MKTTPENRVRITLSEKTFNKSAVTLSVFWDNKDYLELILSDMDKLISDKNTILHHCENLNKLSLFLLQHYKALFSVV